MQEQVQSNSRMAANRLLKDLENKKSQKLAKMQQNIDFLQFPSIQRTGKEISVRKYRDLDRQPAKTSKQVESQKTLYSQPEPARRETQTIDRAIHTYSVLGDKCKVFMDLLDSQPDEEVSRSIQEKDEETFQKLQNEKTGKINLIMEQIYEKMREQGQQESVNIIQICVEEQQKVTRQQEQYRVAMQREMEAVNRRAQDSQRINVSENFINIVDLILRLNNPMEHSDYRQDLQEKHSQKLIDMKLTQLTAINSNSVYTSIIDRTESYLSTLFAQTKAVRAELENKVYEIQQIKQIYASKQIFETDKINELFNIWDKNFITNDKNDIIERQDGSVRYYMKEIENYKRQKEFLEEELAKNNLLIGSLQKKYDDLILKDKFIVMKADVGLQLDLIQDQAIARTECKHVLEKYLDFSYQNPAIDQSLSFENVDSIIASLFSDKSIYDYSFFLDKVVYKDMKHYVIHWFNARLGNSSLAKHYLTEFMKMCKSMSRKFTRCRLMTLMCGLGVGMTELNQSEKVKHLYYQSSDAIRIFVQFAYMVKMMHNDQIDSKCPLVPSFLQEENELFQVQVLMDICMVICQQEKASSDVIINMEKDFQNLYNVDVQQRIQKQSRQKNNTNQSKNKNSGPDNRMIRFDSAVEFLLEVLAMQKIKEVEQFMYQFKLQLNHRRIKDYSQQEFNTLAKKVFEHKKTAFWVQNAFSHFIQNDYSDDPYELVDAFLPYLLLPSQAAKTFYLDFTMTSYKIKPVILNRRSKTNAKLPDFMKIDIDISDHELSEKDKNSLNLLLLDPFNLLIFIEETFFISKDLIARGQKQKEIIGTNNLQLKNELAQLPRKMYNIKNHDVQLSQFEKEQLIRKTSNVTRMLKNLMDLVIQYGQQK